MEGKVEVSELKETQPSPYEKDTVFYTDGMSSVSVSFSLHERGSWVSRLKSLRK